MQSLARVARLSGSKMLQHHKLMKQPLQWSTPSFARLQMSTMKFTESHEYIKVDGNIGTVGITDHAADALGDVVYVDLPSVGATFDAGDSFGSVESVKAASDVYSPVAGEVVEVNEGLEGNPGDVNESPFEKGWFMKLKISDPSELDKLMDEAAYKETL